MQVPKRSIYITVEEYLKDEEDAPSVRQEYVDGQTYAMTGATARHRIIAGNIYRALHAHLKGSPCRADISDAQVHVAATNSFYYPDIVVSCGAVDQDSSIVSDPALVVEVLSRSTASIDRREKLFAYRKIESLKEYVIVHQQFKRIELHKKNDEGHWQMLEFLNGELRLDSMPCGSLELRFDQVYEDVQWPPTSDWQVREETGQYSSIEEGVLEW